MKKTLTGDATWKYFDHNGTVIVVDGSGDDLLKFDGNPKNESFVIPPPTITDPHDLQPQPLDLGVHEESEDEPGVYEVAPGAEVLDSNDDMDEDNEIPFEIPRIRLSSSTFGCVCEGEHRDWCFPWV